MHESLGHCIVLWHSKLALLGNDFELSEISREALVYTKSMLLEKPALRTPSEARVPRAGASTAPSVPSRFVRGSPRRGLAG